MVPCWQVMGTLITAFDDHPTSSDKLVSPLLESDDVLRKLPPVSIVVSSLKYGYHAFILISFKLIDEGVASNHMSLHACTCA